MSESLPDRVEPAPLGWWGPVGQALVVIALLAAFVVLNSTGGEDPNIGAGAALLLVLAMGLPWSLAAWPTQGGLFDALLLGSAVLNVALHVVARELILRRRAKKAAAVASGAV